MIDRSTEFVHPLLKNSIEKIQKRVITKHNAPFRLFETARDHERQQKLLSTGKCQTPITGHLFDFTSTPKLYCTSVTYVYYDNRWSWNLRDTSIACWYRLFGNLVLDVCPELLWGGSDRKATDYTLFSLSSEVIYNNLNQYPCILPA